MAALYGRLQGNRGEATRTGSKDSGIQATLETWEGKVRVDLDADGKFVVSLAEKHGSPVAILQGNVNRRVFGYVPMT
jgi:hypothetical protein